MSTRSEIRFFKDKKQVGCVYHHSDGYPEHITCDLNALGHDHKFMNDLSKAHGTGDDTKCSNEKKPQSDIEYSYEVELNEYGRAEKVKIIHHPFKGKKKEIFNGEVFEAVDKFCKKCER